MLAMSRRGIFRWTVALMGAAVVLAAVATGCGGGGGTGPSQLTKAQFVKQATAICQKSAEEKAPRLEAAIKGEGGRGLFGASNGELEKLASKVVLPLYRETISRLGTLSPQSRDKARVAKVLGEYEAALKEAEADPSLALEGNPFAKADEAAAKYGFDCSL
jgi:hypothetical protein